MNTLPKKLQMDLVEVPGVRPSQSDGDIRHRIIRAVYIVVVEKASDYTEQELDEELRDV